MIIHIGDIAYNLKDKNGFVGDAFMREIEPIAAYIPYMVINGNHDTNCANFLHYEHRFVMPNYNCKVDKYDYFYSFNLGLVNFIGLSSEVYSEYIFQGPEPILRQVKWLEKTLKKNKLSKNKRPWTILYLHRPLYCWQRTTENECSEFENLTLTRGYKDIPGLEDYFFKYGVDIVFYGHERAYQRHYPVYNRTVYKYSSNIYHNPPAPTYILSGAGGCIKCSRLKDREDPNKLQFGAKRSIEIGYTQVHVINKTHIEITQINTQYNKTVDLFLIIKELGYDMYRYQKSNKNKGEYKPSNGHQNHSYLHLSSYNRHCVILHNIPIHKKAYFKR